MKGGKQALSLPRSPVGRPACVGFIVEAQKLTKSKNPRAMTAEAKSKIQVDLLYFYKIVTLRHGTIANYKFINIYM